MAVWSQIQYSKAKEGNRFDAEYYQPANLSLLAVLQKSQPKPLGELAFVTDGIHASPEVVEDGGVRYLSAKCVKDNDFALADTLFISDQQNAANRRTQLRSGDVLITTVGTIGNAAVVQPDSLPANADRHLGIVRLNETCGIDPYFLTTYLNSRYGRFQTWRESTGNVQLNLFIDKIKNLLVPIMSFQKAVAGMTKRSYDKRREAEALYAAAESALTTALGLDHVDLAPRLFYEDRFSQVAAAGRFDAEYFQPRYATLLANLKKCPNVKLMSVKELCGRLKYGTSEKLPYIEDGAPFLRIADLENKRFNLSSVLRIPPQLAQGISEKVHTGDILVSRSGTLGVAVPIKAEFDGAVYGSYFIKTHPNTEEIDPEYLCLFINSRAGQMQVEMLSTGGIQTNLTIDAIEAIMVPVGDKQWQMKFVELVNNSIDSRQESRRLLDTAKRAVEIAIEDGGEAARTFLYNEGR
jgi:restriction endonuclease S subunit